MVCGFSPVFAHQVRRLGYFALCGGRPGLSALDLTTFEKAAKAFNTGLLCALVSFLHAHKQYAACRSGSVLFSQDYNLLFLFFPPDNRSTYNCQQ